MFFFRKVDDERSVFLSNLLFTVDDQQIRGMFNEVSVLSTLRRSSVCPSWAEIIYFFIIIYIIYNNIYIFLFKISCILNYFDTNTFKRLRTEKEDMLIESMVYSLNISSNFERNIILRTMLQFYHLLLLLARPALKIIIFAITGN